MVRSPRSPPLRRCSLCEIAYYCSKTCQRGHWKQHKAACIAAVAARADDARRERLARAVREKGKDKVDDGEDDALCVICLGPPVDPVMVRGGSWFGLRVLAVFVVGPRPSSFEYLSDFFASSFPRFVPHHAAAVRPRVLQVVHGAAA